MRVDRTPRKVPGKFGGFVRTSARHSILKCKAISEPGNPPSAHTGLLRTFMFFGYDRSQRSVVIGPQRLNQKIGDAPHALEHGGVSTVVEGLKRHLVPLAMSNTRAIREARKAYQAAGTMPDWEALAHVAEAVRQVAL